MISKPVRKVRIKIESTDEFQATYINKGFNEKSRQKLIATVPRAEYVFHSFFQNPPPANPCDRTVDTCPRLYVEPDENGVSTRYFMNLDFLEFVDTGECCEEAFYKFRKETATPKTKNQLIKNHEMHKMQR